MKPKPRNTNAASLPFFRSKFTKEYTVTKPSNVIATSSRDGMKNSLALKGTVAAAAATAATSCFPIFRDCKM